MDFELIPKRDHVQAMKRDAAAIARRVLKGEAR